MSNAKDKFLREGFERIRKALEKFMNAGKEKSNPKLVLQPVRNRPTGKFYKN